MSALYETFSSDKHSALLFPRTVNNAGEKLKLVALVPDDIDAVIALRRGCSADAPIPCELIFKGHFTFVLAGYAL